MPAGLGERIFRVLTLDRDVFDEIAADESQTGVALGIVLAVALASGIGRLPDEGLRGLLLGATQSALQWGLWLGAAQAALAGLGRPEALAPLFRTLGFGATAFGLGLFAFVPLLGSLAILAQWLLGFGAAWRAIQSVGALALPEAFVICAASLFGALWGTSVLLSLLAPA